MTRFAAWRRDFLLAMLLILVAAAMDYHFGANFSGPISPYFAVIGGLMVFGGDVHRRQDAQRERIRRLEEEVARLRESLISRESV